MTSKGYPRVSAEAAHASILALCPRLIDGSHLSGCPLTNSAFNHLFSPASPCACQCVGCTYSSPTSCNATEESKPIAERLTVIADKAADGANVAFHLPQPRLASFALPRFALALFPEPPAFLELALGCRCVDLLLPGGPQISPVASISRVGLFAADAIDLVGVVTLILEFLL